MAQLSRDALSYVAAGVRVFAIAAQKQPGAQEWLAANPKSFAWLIDIDRTAIKGYGVYNRFSYDAWRMAHPTAVLVDRGGTVRFIYRTSNQWDIPSSEVMLAGLERLTSET